VKSGREFVPRAAEDRWPIDQFIPYPRNALAHSGGRSSFLTYNIHPMTAPRHQCLICDSYPAAHLSQLATLIIENLQANHRCCYLDSPTMVAGIRGHLAFAGLDVIREIDNGNLVLRSDQGHLVDGRFDTGRMLGLLSDAWSQAFSDGYSGLWAKGDMAWEFAGHWDLAKLLEYELAVERFFEGHPMLFGICQYNIDILPAQAVRHGLQTHRGVYLSDMRARTNPYYVSAESLPHEMRVTSSRPLEEMLVDLQESSD